MIIVKHKKSGVEYMLTDADWQLAKKKNMSQLYIVVKRLPDKPTTEAVNFKKLIERVPEKIKEETNEADILEPEDFTTNQEPEDVPVKIKPIKKPKPKKDD